MDGGIPDYLYSLGHTLNDYVPSFSSLPSLPPVPAVYCEGCKHFLGFWSITNNKALCDTCEEYYLKLNLVKNACGEEGDNFDYDPLAQLNNYLAHPTELRKNIVKEGPLKKLFKGISSDSKWSSVWCVLLQDRIVYFCNRDDALDCLPLGSVNNIKGIKVQQYEDHSNNLHCFIIRRELFEYHFAALTDREAQDWVRAISNPQQLPSSSSPSSSPAFEREQSMLDSFVVIGRPTRFEATPFDWESVSQTTHTILDVSEQKFRASNINISDLAVLTQNDLDDPDEYFACRQELGELASLWVSEHDPMLLLAAGTTDSQLPSNFPSQFEVELTMGRTTSVFKVDRYGLATETSELVQWMTQACSLTTDSVFWNAPQFVLKPAPYREHIFESVPLPSLLYVRESIAKGRVPIKFEIVGLSLQSLKAFIEGDHLKTAFPTLKIFREYLTKRDQEERNRYTNAFTNALNSSMSLTASVFASKPYKTKNIRCFASNDVSRLLELKINSVMNPKSESDRSLVVMVGNLISTAYKYSIHVGIYFGGVPLAPTQYTEWKDKPEWKEWIRFRLPISNIPHEARVCFTFCACKLTTINSAISEKLVQKKAWVNLNLFQSNGIMKQGRMPLKLWTNGEEANPLGVCGQNIQLDATLDIEFASTPLPIVHRSLKVPPSTLSTTATTTTITTTTTATIPPSADSRKPTGEALEFLKKLLRMDSLHRCKAEDRRLIWHYRYWCRTNFPTRLGRVLSSVNWINPLQVQEAHRLLGEWRPLPPVYAMELLDGRFSDRKVREFAVEGLRGLKDNELVPWLAQLVQVLKYEPYHCCALSEFLIFRAVRSFLIGHTLFWHLQAELHNPTVAIRFELLMEAFKKSLQAPLHRTILDGFDTQRSLIRKLRRIADAMKVSKSYSPLFFLLLLIQTLT
jgi:hypothetical protein